MAVQGTNAWVLKTAVHQRLGRDHASPLRPPAPLASKKIRKIVGRAPDLGSIV